MSSKFTDRRKFLRNTAALVGLAAGAGVVPAAGDQMSPSEAATKDCKDNKDLIAYGERSHYVKSVRIPVTERMSPDEFGMTFSRIVADPGFGGNDHGLFAPLRGDPSRLLYSGHQSPGTPADDSRDGGQAADFYGGRTKAPAFCDPRSFPGMQRKSRESHAQKTYSSRTG